MNWKSKGKKVTIGSHSIFVIDEGRRDAPVLLILHGYPSCSYDYYKVLPILTKKYRVVVHDHLGFGYSDKSPEYSYSLIDQAEMAMALWQKLGISEATLLGHDYGTSVLTEIVARWNYGFRPINITGLIVGNGSMLIDMSQLLLSQKILMNPRWGPLLAKLATRGYFHYNMKKLWADKSKYDRADIDVLFDLCFDSAARKVFSNITQYIAERHKYWDRWITNGIFKTDLPVHIYWGDKDPVAVIAMADRLQKNISGSTLEVLENVGHYPMLEAPEKWAGVVERQMALLTQ